ncbi:MAG: hypothetical protein ACFFCM_07465 [Promethearchaeota archaeon]
MEIRTLKDLKEALSKVPDNILDNFGIGITDDGISLCTAHGEDEAEMCNYFAEMRQKYPVLTDIVLIE